MVKKTTKSTAVTKGTALATIPDGSLVPLVGSDYALAKLTGSDGSVFQEDGVTLVTGRSYATRDHTVPASEIFFSERAKPDQKGPWLGEADKLSWRDEETGFECIILRESGPGYLCGYVGVPQDHR